MTQTPTTLEAHQITGRGRSVNPFVILEDAASFIAFAEEVFGEREVVEVRTPTPTGRLIHAELRIGDSLLLLADAQEGWHTRPGLFQIWVSDVQEVIAHAVDKGAVVVTPPTPFYGSITLARIQESVGQPLVALPTGAGTARPDASVGRRLGRHLSHPRRVPARRPLKERRATHGRRFRRCSARRDDHRWRIPLR
jgi:PhnB protein